MEIRVHRARNVLFNFYIRPAFYHSWVMSSQIAMATAAM
eukprot:COSAG02_NODE_60890_length_270_cov_0.596491_1_plen_38_part_01